MGIPSNKSELTSAIIENYSKLLNDIVLIPKDKIKIKNLTGHQKNTKMSIHNLISYLVGWGELVIKWHQTNMNSNQSDLPELGFKWNELGLLANKFYIDYQDIEFSELLIQLENTKSTILDIIKDETNDYLYHQPWYKHYPFGRMIQLNTSSPYKNARIRIRKWIKENEI